MTLDSHTSVPLCSDMETCLPQLKFSNYAKALLAPTNSTWKSSSRSHPRTDLDNLVPWDTFPTDINTAIESAMKHHGSSSDSFSISGLSEDSIIENEEALRAHVKYALHIPVEKVAKELGLQGSFRFSGSGNIAIVGGPDFCWVVDVLKKPHPTLVVSLSFKLDMCSYLIILCRPSINLGGLCTYLAFSLPSRVPTLIRLQNKPWKPSSRSMDT